MFPWQQCDFKIILVSKKESIKAVVGGPAMAGPLFLTEMVLAGPRFWPNMLLQDHFLKILLDLLNDLIGAYFKNDNRSVRWSIFRLPQGVKDSG